MKHKHIYECTDLSVSFSIDIKGETMAVYSSYGTDTMFGNASKWQALRCLAKRKKQILAGERRVKMKEPKKTKYKLICPKCKSEHVVRELVFGGFETICKDCGYSSEDSIDFDREEHK